MRQRARDRVVTGVVVLLGALVGAGLAFHPWGSRPHPGRLLAFDLTSGAQRFDIPAQTASVLLHAIGRGVVVVSGADDCNDDPDRESLYAYSLPAGSLRWTRPLKGACFDDAHLDPVSDGIVAVGTDAGLEGWSVTDGVSRWNDPALQERPRQTTRDIVYVGSESGAVRFLDPRTGRVRRSAPARAHPYPLLLTPDRTVLVTQRSSDPGFEEQLTAIDPATARIVWRRTLARSTGLVGPPGADGVIVAGLGPPNASHSNVAVTYEAFDIRDGRMLWRRRQPARWNSLDGELQATGAGLALFVHESTLEALDLRTGVRRWKMRLTGWKPGGDSQIVAAQGSVAIVDQDRATVLRARDGTRRWTSGLSTDGLRAHFPAAIDNGLLIIPATSSSWIPYDE